MLSLQMTTKTQTLEPHTAKILPAGRHYGTLLNQWSSEDQMVCRIEYRRGSQYDEHGNERASVFFIERGCNKKKFGKKSLELLQGSMLLIPPSCLHADRFESNTSVLAAEIPVAVLQGLQEYGAVLHDPVLVAEYEARAFQVRLRRELLAPDELSGLVFEGLFSDLLVSAVRKSKIEDRRPVPWLLRSRDLLHDRVHEPLQLREIASEVNVHPARLSRDFKRTFGLSPGEYLRCLRIELATQRIEGTDESLAEIAATFGFADQAHLSRVFRKQMGLSPSRYRTATKPRSK